MQWAETLAEMEGRVEAAERTLRDGGPPPPAFRLPESLGPLPADLVTRARRIELDTALVASRVAAARDLLAAALCRPRPATAPAPSYIDARA